jgi:hypothetical protein
MGVSAARANGHHDRGPAVLPRSSPPMWWAIRRLMGADEEGTHERLKAHLRDLVDPQIREHYGRIVKTTGLL